MYQCELQATYVEMKNLKKNVSTNNRKSIHQLDASCLQVVFPNWM